MLLKYSLSVNSNFSVTEQPIENGHVGVSFYCRTYA